MNRSSNTVENVVQQTADQCARPSWVDHEVPVTPDQEQRLLVRELRPDSSIALRSADIRLGFRIWGDVASRSLSVTLNKLVHRHAALRSRFAPALNISLDERRERIEEFARTGIPRGGVYSQSLVEVGAVQLRTVEFLCESRDRSAVDQYVRQVIDEELGRSLLNLDPPHLRAVLVRVGEREGVLILFINHLVADRFSMGVLRKSFLQLLKETLAGQLTVQGHVDRTFLEHVDAQDRRIRNGEFEESLAFWLGQWSRFGSERIAPRHFPFALVTGEQSDVSFSMVMTVLDGETAATIRSLAKRCRVTLHTLFLAAFAIALTRITGKKKPAIWTNFANRTRGPHFDSVGWFSQTHLLGVETGGDQTVSEFLTYVHETVTQALKHQEMPLSYLWTQLGCYPRFQDAKVLLEFIPYRPPCPESFDNLTVEDLSLPDSSSPRLASLGMYVKECETGISTCIKFVDALYPKAAIERLLQDFGGLVGRMEAAELEKVSDFVVGAPSGASIPASEAMSEFVVMGSHRLLGLSRDCRR